MVMCRPTYISGPARNGSIPPITVTDGPGQGSSMFHMYIFENLFKQSFLAQQYLYMYLICICIC